MGRPRVIDVATPPTREHPPRPHEVSNAALREAFLASGKTAGEVAAAAGWYMPANGRRVPEGGRVNRALGLTASRYRMRQTAVYRTTAAVLAEAIGVDPTEAGL